MLDSAYLFVLLGTGLALGFRHAFDADHVVAVSTLVSGNRSLKSSLQHGFLWGTGHTATLLLTGLVVLTLKLGIPNNVAAVLELIVGFMLVALGVVSMPRYDRSGGGRPSSPAWRWIAEHGPWRSFLVGSVHGLAGSAALMLLVLSTVSSLITGVVYIVVFGLGSIVGMLLVSAAMTVPLTLAGLNPRFHASIRWIASLASIVIGLLIVADFLRSSAGG